jgi:hypothetical protein
MNMVMLEMLTMGQRILTEDLLTGFPPCPAVGVEKECPGGAEVFRQSVHRESRIPLRSLRQLKRHWEWAGAAILQARSLGWRIQPVQTLSSTR